MWTYITVSKAPLLCSVILINRDDSSVNQLSLKSTCHFSCQDSKSNGSHHVHQNWMGADKRRNMRVTDNKGEEIGVLLHDVQESNLWLSPLWVNTCFRSATEMFHHSSVVARYSFAKQYFAVVQRDHKHQHFYNRCMGISICPSLQTNAAPQPPTSHLYSGTQGGVCAACRVDSPDET